MIRINGTVLASLLYECASGKGDIEGVLLGTTATKTTMGLMNDTSDQALEKRQGFIIIHGYRLVNILEKGELQQEQDEQFVGYFKFKQQQQHVELDEQDFGFIKEFSEKYPKSCFGLFTATLNDPSTHHYDFAFWNMKNPTNKLPLQIINMTENPLEYQSFMSNAPFSTPLSSNNLLVQVASSDVITNQYNGIFQEAIKSLEVATERVIQKEAQLSQLQKEIDALMQNKPIDGI